MPGLVPGIHVLTSLQDQRRGWPGRARPWRVVDSICSGFWRNRGARGVIVERRSR